MMMMTRRLLGIAVCSLFAASPSFGQQATINAPLAPPADAKIIVARIEIVRAPARAIIEVSYQDAANNETKRLNFWVPADQTNPGTELQDFIGALINPRTGETGANGRRLNFRALGYLADSGRITGVTLVP